MEVFIWMSYLFTCQVLPDSWCDVASPAAVTEKVGQIIHTFTGLRGFNGNITAVPLQKDYYPSEQKTGRTCFLFITSVSSQTGCWSICLCCSGAGQTHRLRAEGGTGGEPLLVGSDLPHGLLVLLRCGFVPAHLHVQTAGAVWTRRRQPRRLVT